MVKSNRLKFFEGNSLGRGFWFFDLGLRGRRHDEDASADHDWRGSAPCGEGRFPGDIFIVAPCDGKIFGGADSVAIWAAPLRPVGGKSSCGKCEKDERGDEFHKNEGVLEE